MEDQIPTSPSPRKDPRKRTASPAFWSALFVWGILLVIFVIGTGVAGLLVWLLLTGLFVAGTALYSWIFRRRSWLYLSGLREQRLLFLTGAGVAVLALVGVALTAPGLPSTQLADSETETSSSPSTQTSSADQETESSLLGEECPAEEESTESQGEELVCTREDDGTLVWMDKESSERIIAEREAASAEASRAAEAENQKRVQEASASAEAQRVAEEAAAAEAQRIADEAAAAAEAQRIADEAAAAAEAQRIADEAAAEAEAQRLAEEARRQVEPPAPGNDVYYNNCSEAKAAGRGPISSGEPGYGLHLDGNQDGVGCEAN